MGLKSYLRALMKTRTTPAEAGHSAMPHYGSKVLVYRGQQIDSWGDISGTAYTAPYDCFVSANAVTTNINAASQLALKNGNDGQSISASITSGSEGLGIRTTGFLKKGDTIKLAGSWVRSVYMEVYKLVGGV